MRFIVFFCKVLVTLIVIVSIVIRTAAFHWMINMKQRMSAG
jgi:hypothetical protein